MSFEDKKDSSEGVLNNTDQNIYPLPETKKTQEFDSQVNTEKSLPDSKEEALDKNVLEASDKKEEKNEPTSRFKDLFEGKVDQKLYDEVLEKLDIKPKQEIQEKSMQDAKQEAYPDKLKEGEKLQIETMVETAIVQDFAKIQKLMQTGLINSVQGQNLKRQVLQKAFDKLVQTEKIKRNLSPALNQPTRNNANGFSTGKNIYPPLNMNEVFEEFNKSNPDFFNPEGRKEVLDYLKSNDVIFEKEELNKISNIVRTVEKNAIDRYLQKIVHEKTLRDSNEFAKQKLTANAQKSGSSGNLLRTFTREQIGKMTSAEFTKYESQIMNQLKKGLIR